MIHRASGKTEEVPVTLRIDTPIEIDYYQHGGILPYVLQAIARRHDGFLSFSCNLCVLCVSVVD